MPRLVGPVVAAGSIGQSEQPEIALGADLVLRPWELRDAPAVVSAFSDPDIQRWHMRAMEYEAEAEAWVTASHDAWAAETAASWAIAHGPDLTVAGRVTIYMRLEQGDGEVAYWVLPQARRQGLATRACLAATRWAHRIGIHRVVLEHSVHNQASRRVALSVGYREEGVRRDGILHADGWHDATVYSHLATDE